MNLDPRQDWQVRYAAKIASAEQAVRLIPPRKRILIGSGAAEPSGLVEAMVAHGTHLEGNEVVHLMTLGSAPTSSRASRGASATPPFSSAPTSARRSRKDGPTSCRSSSPRSRSSSPRATCTSASP